MSRINQVTKAESATEKMDADRWLARQIEASDRHRQAHLAARTTRRRRSDADDESEMRLAGLRIKMLEL
jgi:hypothetical protein